MQHNEPRLLYFISRNNNTIVPLIPADELPFNVRLADVPRVMSFDKTFGMQHVASAPYTGLTFKLDDIQPSRPSSQSSSDHNRSQSSTPKHFLAPDAYARQALSVSSNPMHTLPYRPLSAHESTSNWRKAPTSAPKNPQDVIDAILNTPQGSETASHIGYTARNSPVPPPSGNVIDPERKEFCTYWIRTGECDFIQQGCLYKHEMPATLEKLQSLGIMRYPKWWQEKKQQVKIGYIGFAGPKMKAEEWLNASRKGSIGSSNQDSGSESEDVEPGNGRGAMKFGTRKVDSVVGAGASLKPAHAAENDESMTRHLSVTGDLISFPAPPPSPASSSTTASPDSSPTSGIVTPASSIAEKTTLPQKVFVPAGESAEKHIADAKKRTRSNKQEKQEKAFNGLMASKHAFSGPVAQDLPRGLRPRVPRAKARVAAAAAARQTTNGGDAGGKATLAKV